MKTRAERMDEYFTRQRKNRYRLPDFQWLERRQTSNAENMKTKVNVHIRIDNLNVRVGKEEKAPAEKTSADSENVKNLIVEELVRGLRFAQTDNATNWNEEDIAEFVLAKLAKLLNPRNVRIVPFYGKGKTSSTHKRNGEH